MTQFIEAYEIKLKESSASILNKTGIVERKHWTAKCVLERLQNDAMLPSDAGLLSRPTFLSKIFPVSRLLASFALAKGYNTALLGVNSKILSDEELKAYKINQ